jgi:hypothetical protein
MMNRREFLYALGGGSAAIIGWVLLPGLSQPSHAMPAPQGEFRPRLAPGISYRMTPDGGQILRTVSGGLPSIVGQLNDHGLRLVEALDGTRSVSQLAAHLRGRAEPRHQANTETAVVKFLATLAQAGLLTEPFFVNLYDAQVTA